MLLLVYREKLQILMLPSALGVRPIKGRRAMCVDTSTDKLMSVIQCLLDIPSFFFDGSRALQQHQSFLYPISLVELLFHWHTLTVPLPASQKDHEC